MESITEYVQKKVDRISPTGGRSNGTGATLLSIYNQKNGHTVEENVKSALESIVATMHRSETQGLAKLTMVSTSIGKQVLRRIGLKDPTFTQQVRTGDLFLEAMYALGFIDVYRDPAFSKFSQNAPYLVQLESKWSDIADIPTILVKKDLRGTQYEAPSYPTRRVLKRDLYSKEEWEVVRKSQHINAVHKIQQQEFRVNLEVLDAVEKNIGLFAQEGKIEIPKEGNKKAMDDAYYSWRMAENRNKDPKGKAVTKAKEKYVREALLWNEKLIALKQQSKKTAIHYTLQKARILRNEPYFYQTVELDYRGRFYYTESFFNFQGTDVARGILEFAEGKTIDADGRRWLAIHTACSYNASFERGSIPSYFEEDYDKYLEEEGLESISVDKMTLNDRALWTENNLDTIIKYVEEETIPIQAEKPVVFYACAVEWSRYLCDPEGYKSRLPIQIDGSNNGWQHLGAMSKDSKTGELVGLVPSRIQKDFYVQTAKELINLVPDWFEEHKMPMKHIRKGISKRGSMTRAYSAGEKTMATNMYADCYQEGFTDTYGIKVEDCNLLSHHLISSINKVCPGPLETMGFLQKLAAYEIGTFKWFKDGKLADKKYKSLKKTIKDLKYKKEKTEEDLIGLSAAVEEASHFESVLTKGNGSSVITWTTPSGFYVVYENYIQRSVKCKGSINGVGRINHVAQERTAMPNLKGYMAGISPNFVHSLDGSHLAILVDNYEGSFAAVHDAFATHACDVESLVALTKESFISIYEEDNFYDYIETTLLSDTEGLTVEQPSRGDLDIGRIRESDYFFA